MKNINKDQLDRHFGLFFNLYDGQAKAAMLTALMTIQYKAKLNGIKLEECNGDITTFLKLAAQALPECTAMTNDLLDKVRDFGSSHNHADIIKLILSADLTDEDPKELGWVFQKHLGRSDSTDLIDRELAEIAADYLAADIGEDVHCPMQGSFSFAYALAVKGANVHYSAATIEGAIWAEWMSAWFNLPIKVTIAHHIKDYLDFPDQEMLNNVAMIPPSGLRLDVRDLSKLAQLHYKHKPCSSDALFLQFLLGHLRGKAVIMLSQSFLTRTTAGDKTLKQELVASGKLDAVIQCWATFTSPVMLLINSESKNQPLLIKASDENFKQYCDDLSQSSFNKKIIDLLKGEASPFSRLISISEAAANNWNLDVGRFVLTSEEMVLKDRMASMSTVPLKEIAEFVRCQALTNEDSGDECFFEVNQTDIDKMGLVKIPTKKLMLSDGKAITRANRQKIRTGDILLTVKGKVGKVGLVSEDMDKNIVAGQSFIIVRLKPSGEFKEPVCLFRYLNSPMVQGLLLGKASGVFVSVIKMKDIEELPVLELNSDQRQEALHKHQQTLQLRQQVIDIEKKIAFLQGDDWLSMKI
jgi:type I restriction enzyme M protein